MSWDKYCGDGYHKQHFESFSGLKKSTSLESVVLRALSTEQLLTKAWQIGLAATQMR
jgi:hypothetical protein